MSHDVDNALSSAPGAKEDNWVDDLPSTPAFVYDERRLQENLDQLKGIRDASGCRMLYSIKASPFTGLLQRIQETVDGFSVSSLFEARLAREVIGNSGRLHITTPGFRRDEMSEIGALCDHVSFNSIGQLQRFSFMLGGRAEVGLRINPQLSFADDHRYDPCRPHSKLGVPLDQLVSHWQSGALSSDNLKGLHLHTNFAADNLEPLRETVMHIEAQLPELVREIDWINLGGGYLFNASNDLKPLLSTIEQIQTIWGTEVILEPGNAVVGDAGRLVASVIDRFESDASTIAVLDSSVNHLPEVFEYQRRPQLGFPAMGDHPVILAGSTCLSGDLFGEYHLNQPLKINDRVVFEKVGAYSLIKASRFNGQNLPSIYFLDEERALQLMKKYEYDDYRRQWSDEASRQQTSISDAG
jgi:carboxynorspermidine decarboxylase